MSFGGASATPSAAIVPATIHDADGDDLEGQIQVGRADTVVSLIEPSAVEPIYGTNFMLRNLHNATLESTSIVLEFRAMGAPTWATQLRRDAMGASFPTSIEARDPMSHQVMGAFEILAWDDTGATISATNFVPSAQVTYSGALPGEIGISSVPDGSAAVRIGASDGSTWGFGQELFTKTAGQTRLLLTQP